jgi:aspartate carbamoyltransferase catalytic subunit
MPVSHFLSTKDLSDASLQAILRNAKVYVSELGLRHDRTQTLIGRNIVLAFFEPSTRTRLSFETAAHRLGASTVVFQPPGSSIEKGETLEETIATINAMRFDAMVVRHSRNGMASEILHLVDMPVVNAGEGTTSHPTQAILDASTLLERHGTLQGARICVVGDVRHSRVARSQADVFRRLGAEYAVCAPPELLPEIDDPDLHDCQRFTSIDEAMEWSTVISLLRIQKERIAGIDVSDVESYRRGFSLTSSRLERFKDGSIIHPGPVNVGVEVDEAVLRSPESLIHRQVTHGVAVRMAVLSFVLAHHPAHTSH